MKKTLLNFAVIGLLFLGGCGYKPVSHYAREQIHGLVYVSSETSLQDPQNSVVLQDSISQMIVGNLGLVLTDKKELADTIVDVSLGKPTISQIQYDTQGYVRTYRATVKVTLNYDNKQKKGTVSSSGEYDFEAGDIYTITDAERFNAIKQASSKALEDILGKLAVESFKRDKQN
jgi:hypothetical protein